MDRTKVETMDLKAAQELGIDQWGEWSCEVSTFDWYYDESETFYVLEGEVIVSAGDKEVHIEKGMLVTFPKGLECVWDVKRPIRKKYIFN